MHFQQLRLYNLFHSFVLLLRLLSSLLEQSLGHLVDHLGQLVSLLLSESGVVVDSHGCGVNRRVSAHHQNADRGVMKFTLGQSGESGSSVSEPFAGSGTLVFIPFSIFDTRLGDESVS